ncbi:hypothetical protein Pcinc_035138 [Petrolisthes cinctipes]|uniref:Uncharacterized protein n=1 Tax=Petrolisthes cinctipes TaxID=88211 RepID=A0AAE1ENK7_PETCI|nr:hypothetical protein Pcinc_035138 [Petrolisthes cinctipes]
MRIEEKTGSLDLLVGDSAVLDYLRGNDPGCTLARKGEDLVSDTFAVAMAKGFPLRVKINTILARYLFSGHLDHLKHKWYGELLCSGRSADIYKPQALEVSTVGGVFVMLTLGIGVGFILLVLEHIVYRYALPSLRTKPKESVWRNRNLMFFSQKLYKFINCVELVSPHHSAKELVNNLRTGQIMGLFQKSVKRKENEQRRRRKSKAQFFEMIQEIRRVQKAEKEEETMPISTPTTMTGGSRKGESPPPELPDATPAPPSPFSSPTTPAPISIDYLPGPNPHEDSEGIIVVNSSVPLGKEAESSTRSGQDDICKEEEDESSGILILKVSDPEEVLEANTLNQQLEERQAFMVAGEGGVGEFEVCSCGGKDSISSRSRKTSGGCLNCLQRQDSARQVRKGVEGACLPCSSASSARESSLSEPLNSSVGGTANGLRHRGSGPNPPLPFSSPPVPSAATKRKSRSSVYGRHSETSDDPVWSTRSLEELDPITGEPLPGHCYDGVRLVPLSQQTALKSSGSLQLVAALSPADLERVNSDHLRHVTKADLWQLWQDSERQLRVRLRQAESQRDELLRLVARLPQRDRLGLPEGSSEEWENRSLRDMTGDSFGESTDYPDAGRKGSSGSQRRSGGEDISGGSGGDPSRHRSVRRATRERHPDDMMRMRSTRRESSITPRKKRRPRSKSHDYLETRRSSDTLDDRYYHPRFDSRSSPYRNANRRRRRDESQERIRLGLEDFDSLTRHRTKGHSVESVIERTILADSAAAYYATPLPLLHSLHQQNRHDAERNYSFLQNLPPLDRRESRIPSDTYTEHIHLQTLCREIRGRSCESDDPLDDDRHWKSEEERMPLRRRRAAYRATHADGQPRSRPRERLPSWEFPESLHRRESSLQRDTRHSMSSRRPYEREPRTISPFISSHRQHSVRKRTSYDSSSDQEDGRFSRRTPPELHPSGRETHGKRHTPQLSSVPRPCEGRRIISERMDERRGNERKLYREVREPP